MSTPSDADSGNFPQEGQLAALDFAREFARWDKEFFGRDALFALVDDLLRDGQHQLLVLTGEPGIGKSAFAAQLARRRADIAAVHFCIDGRISTVTPGTVLRSIAAQLVKSLPGYAEALVETIKPHQLTIHVGIRVERLEAGGRITGVVIHRLATGNPSEDLEILLRGPLAAMKPPPQPALIIIDGLDEAVRHGGASNLAALLGNLGELPRWVRLFYTTQPTDAVLRHLEFLHPKMVHADQPGDSNDVARYVESRVAKEPVRGRLLEAGVEARALTAAIAARAANNFLFCLVLLDDIEAGRQSLSDLDALPPSIDEIYRRYLLRFCHEDWYDLHQPILGKLAVCRDNITEDQLVRFSGKAASRVRRSLGTIDRFLSVAEEAPPKVFRLYHNSLRSFLLDKDRAGFFWCDAVEEHRGVADSYHAEDRKPAANWDRYGLRNLPSHLAAADEHAALRGLLLDYVWLRAKLGAATVQDVLADFTLIEPDENVKAVAAVLRLSAAAISRDPEQLSIQMNSRTMRAGAPVKRMPASRDAYRLRSLNPSLRQFDDPLVWSLTGHQRSVQSIAALPGSPFIVTASLDGTVRFWDLARGVEVRKPLVHSGEVDSLGVAPNGKEIVTASRRDISIWDVETGEKVDGFEDPNAWSVAISDRGRIALTGLGVRIWDRETRKSFPVLERGAWTCLFIPGSTYIALRTDASVIVLNVENGETIHQFEHGGFEMGTRALAVSRNGRFVASAGHEGSPPGYSFRILDLESDACRIFHQNEHRGPVETLAFTQDASRLISGARAALGKPPLDHTVRVWDLKTERCIATFTGHSSNVNSVAASWDDRYAISAAGDRRLLVWDLERPRSDISAHQGSVTAAVVTASGRSILTASQDGVVNEWDVASHSLQQARQSEESIIALAATANGKTILASCSEYSIIFGGSYFVDAVRVFRSGVKQPSVLVEHHGSLRVGHYLAACITDDGRCAILGRRDDEGMSGSPGAVELWDIKKRKLIRSVPYPHKFVRAIMTLKEPGKVLIADTDLAIWDSSDKSSMAVPFASGGDTILSLALSPDGRVLAVGRTGGAIEIWDLAAKTRIAAIAAHEYEVTGVAFLGSSRSILSVGDDSCLKIWDWEHSKPAVLFVGDDAFTALAVTPDGRTIVVGEAHGRVHFLRVEGETDVRQFRYISIK